MWTRAWKNGWRLLAVPPGTHIPRVIRQTFPTQPLPAPVADSIAAMLARNPGWSHDFYDDAAMRAFIRREYGRRILRTFDRIDPAYGAVRADLFRYLLMYRLGGVYLDSKSRFTGSIDAVLRPGDRYVLTQWDNQPGGRHEGWGIPAELYDVLPTGEFQQWHIICAPGHPFLRAVILHVLDNILHYDPVRDGVGLKAVLRLSGPTAYSAAILPLLGTADWRHAGHNGDIGLDYSVLDWDHHQRLFATHYTTLETPIVRPGRWWQNGFFPGLRP